MKIGNIEIGYGQPTFVIAECCSNIINHINETIGDLLDEIKHSGATACKVQLYRAEHFPEAEYKQKRATEFPRGFFKGFVDMCHWRNLLVGASVFDAKAVQLCMDCNADFLKLATREFQNDDLLHICLNADLPIFQSYDSNLFPSGLVGTNDLLRLACNPRYPVLTPKVSGEGAGSDWGWSSHTPHWLDCLIAVSRGACVIEKHIGFHHDDPEMGWSLYPQQFKKMIEEIRIVERMR